MAEQRKSQLIAQLAHARAQAAVSSQALAEDLKIGDKLKENIEQNRGVWLAGAALTGLVIAKIPPRTKKILVNGKGAKVEQEIEKAGKVGLFLGALRVVFNLVRPLLVRWITRKLQASRPGYARGLSR